MGERRNGDCATRGLRVRSIIRPLVSGAVLAPSNRMAEHTGALSRRWGLGPPTARETAPHNHDVANDVLADALGYPLEVG